MIAPSTTVQFTSASDHTPATTAICKPFHREQMFSYRIFPVLIPADACMPYVVPVTRYCAIIPRPVMVHLMYLLRYVLRPWIWCVCEMCSHDLILLYQNARMFEKDREKAEESRNEVDDEDEDEDERNVDSWPHVGGYVGCEEDLVEIYADLGLMYEEQEYGG